MKRLDLAAVCPVRPSAFAAVSLWCIDLDAPGPATEAGVALQADERERAARFVFERDRRRYVAGRTSLRRLLAQHLDTAADALHIGYGAHGRPFLVNPPRPLDFNVSHSQHLALVALCEGAMVGVDLEWRRPLPELRDLAAAHFTRREQEAVRVGDSDEAHRRFFRTWTRKEACLKAWGSGLGWPTQGFEVGCDTAPAHVVAPAGDSAVDLEVCSLVLAENPGFEAAVSLGRRAGSR